MHERLITSPPDATAFKRGKGRILESIDSNAMYAGKYVNTIIMIPR